MTHEQFIERLFKIGAVKFGSFTLKSGLVSPFYIDLRDMISFPDILDGIVDLLVEQIKELEFDVLTGIPYTALPIASLVADRIKKPLIYMRKEEKAYGTGNDVIGKFEEGMRCLVIDDLITTGESKIETAEKLEAQGVEVLDFSVVIDRSKDGTEILGKAGYKLHSLISLDKILEVLKEKDLISDEIVAKVNEFTASIGKAEKQEKSYKNNLTENLLATMKRKQSNLIVSLDVTTQAEFFEILEKVASEIVMLKTHVDILEDFDDTFVNRLKEMSQKYDFHIFEDRKFADIGNTVKMQFKNGIYKICDWAEFVTVHLVAGAGTLSGLFTDTKDRSGFLLARMSSKGNLINETYSRKVIAAGKEYWENVSGYIGHGKNVDDIRRFKTKLPNGQLLLMPGVKLEAGTDKLGQQYITIEDAVGGGADCIIVGRGIIKSDDVAASAKEYKTRAWNAYTKREKGE